MYSELGEKVRLLRKRRGLKQDDLGELLKLSRSQVSNLESGRRNLSLKQLEKLCEYFKVDMSYFLMSETTDSCLDLIEKAKILFDSKELTNSQKEDLFTSIMKIYLDSKEK
ncbi:MAG: helix-turn-helix transcriptional regulator [Bacilli bacterium]|nr:helix-turn-helix transcriptional regulator [Bacilli bacterium]